MTDHAPSLDEALTAVQGPNRGGAVFFLGTVRDDEDGMPIAAIRYEAYEAMALQEMGRIAREASVRWNAAVAVRHRVGRVPVGETAFLVAAAAAHRPEAFAACRWVVDRVKADAPIWKTSFEALP